MSSLLEQFAAEDATPYVRHLIADVLRERERNPARERHQFDFNRFSITFDFLSGTVLIEDDFDVDPVTGEARLALAEFVSYLGLEAGPPIRGS